MRVLSRRRRLSSDVVLFCQLGSVTRVWSSWREWPVYTCEVCESRCKVKKRGGGSKTLTVVPFLTLYQPTAHFYIPKSIKHRLGMVGGYLPEDGWPCMPKTAWPRSLFGLSQSTICRQRESMSRCPVLRQTGLAWRSSYMEWLGTRRLYCPRHRRTVTKGMGGV